MTRKTSKIMDAKAEKKAAQAATLKADRKTLKADASSLKKAVTEAQKDFLANPQDQGAAKAYRTAVADHISAVKQLNKVESKLAA